MKNDGTVRVIAGHAEDCDDPLVCTCGVGVTKPLAESRPDSEEELVKALREAVALIPRGLTDCAGWKCRQQNCHACMEEPVAYDVSGFEALIERYEKQASSETEER